MIVFDRQPLQAAVDPGGEELLLRGLKALAERGGLSGEAHAFRRSRLESGALPLLARFGERPRGWTSSFWSELVFRAGPFFRKFFGFFLLFFLQRLA